MTRLLLALVFAFYLTGLNGQDLNYTISRNYSKIISEKFNNTSILNVKTSDLYEALAPSSTRNKYVNWKTPSGEYFEIVVSSDDIISPQLVTRVITESGIKVIESPKYTFFTGYLKSNDASEVTILRRGENFTSITIKDGKRTHILTNASRYDQNARKEEFLYYRAEDQLSKKDIACGIDNHPEFRIKGNEIIPTVSRQAGECFPVKLGIGADYAFFQEQGASEANVMDEIMDIMASVASNYVFNGSQNFADGIEYKIVEFVISNGPTTDPWTSSNDAGDLLSSFNTWVNNGGFSTNVEMASLWTNRDFGGMSDPTIGLAYLGSGLICGGAAHQVLEHFSNNIDALRALTAHEMGHNWSGVHDPEGSTDIMGPSINTNNPPTTWSAGSKTDIGGEITTQGNACLTGLCNGSCPAGCADFTADKKIEWSSGTINFLDQSVNANSWLWDFGDGGTSTQQNPSHTYSSPGKYTVTLTVNNGDALTLVNFIDILPREEVPYELADGGNMNAQDFGASNINSDGALWEKGVATNFFPSNTGWTTDLDGDVPNTNIETAVFSPNFNMANSGTYDITFTLGMEAEFCNAPYAVQVQYSTNLGDTWTRLGSDSDNNWYNRGPSSGCTIATGIFADGMGFNFTNSAANFTYDVSFLGGNENVVFRFVFSVDPNYTGGYQAGAYMDNFTLDGPASNVVPIELTSFDGYTKGEVNVLEWETSSEVNSDFFIVQKSNDGRTFEEIGQVLAAGNSTETESYSFVDEYPSSGINYYQLNQFDMDGRSEVFGPITIDFSGRTSVQIYPNILRTGQRLNIKAEMDEDGSMPLQIIGINGGVVQSIDISMNKGRNVKSVVIDDFPAGSYIVVVKGSVVSKLAKI